MQHNNQLLSKYCKMFTSKKQNPLGHCLCYPTYLSGLAYSTVLNLDLTGFCSSQGTECWLGADWNALPVLHICSVFFPHFFLQVKFSMSSPPLFSSDDNFSMKLNLFTLLKSQLFTSFSWFHLLDYKTFFVVVFIFFIGLTTTFWILFNFLIYSW